MSSYGEFVKATVATQPPRGSKSRRDEPDDSKPRKYGRRGCVLAGAVGALWS